MIEFAGRVVAKEHGSYIYIIKKGPYLYIGETQRNPIQRWNEHLQENGSFQSALRSRDEDYLLKNVGVEFFAYRCSRIESEAMPVETRRVTQLVEHELHVKFICRGKGAFELISNTLRTAPTGSKYNWVSDLVNQIYEEFWERAKKELSCD